MHIGAFLLGVLVGYFLGRSNVLSGLYRGLRGA